MTHETKLKKATVYLLLFLMLFFLLFPFYWTLVTSLKTETELYSTKTTFWPKELSFISYRRLFTSESVNFVTAMKNSLFVAIVTTIISVTISTMASYAFVRFRFKGRKLLMCIFLSNNMFPTVLLLIPLYSIMRRLGILYTPYALILAYTTFTIPFTVWLLNGFIKDIPMSLEEAALVDGCNRRQAFRKITLPILIPAIMATAVYIFMSAWNEYTYAALFTNNASRTVPVTLNSLIGQLGVEWGLLTAGGIVTILPICIMFFFAQKTLVEGLTNGAVKG